jgi:uncharacterized SAM-binding protein YcdF (DUF218 family)
MLFAMGKIILSFVIPPGVFIVFVVCIGYFQFRRHDRLWFSSLALAVLIYLISLPVIANYSIDSVEYHAGDQSLFAGADCIVVPGGGVVQGVRDLSGFSVPSEAAVTRVLDACRLYRIYKKPIIVSGGSVAGSEQEAFVLARFLTDLGIPQSQIIIEDKARNTHENALFTKEICERRGYQRIILVTSAFHARRSEYLFKREGLTVSVYPSGQLAEKDSFSWLDFLPSSHSLYVNALALKEMLGLIAVKL